MLVFFSIFAQFQLNLNLLRLKLVPFNSTRIWLQVVGWFYRISIDLLGTYYIQSQKLQLYVVVVSVLLACFPKEWRPLVDGHDVKIVVYYIQLLLCAFKPL